MVGDKIGHSRTLEVADKAGQHKGKDGGQSKVLGKTDSAARPGQRLGGGFGTPE